MTQSNSNYLNMLKSSLSLLQKMYENCGHLREFHSFFIVNSWYDVLQLYKINAKNPVLFFLTHTISITTSYELAEN